MKDTAKTKPRQGQKKPRARRAKEEQSDEERKRVEEALRESEARFSTVFRTSPIGIVITRPADGRVIDVNPAFLDIFGYTREETIGHTTLELKVWGYPEERDKLIKILRKKGRLHEFETKFRHKSGEIGDLVVSAELIELTGEQYMLSVMQDITGRKQAEAALRQRAEELAALQATVLEIAAPHDLPSLLHTIVERAAHLLNANSGGLYLCDPAREEVRCVVSYNTPQDYTGTVLKYGEGAAGIVAQSGKPLVIDDYRSWSGRAAAFDEQQPFMAVLSTPMIWQGQVTGVIHVLHNMEGRLFSQADLDLLTQFANHAAVAVENTHLYEDAQKEIAERKQAEDALQKSNLELNILYEAVTAISSHLSLDVVLQTVAEKMTQALGSSECALSLWRREESVVETLTDYSVVAPGQTEPPGTTYDLNDYPSTRQVLETGELLLIHRDDPNADKAEAALLKKWNVYTLLMLPLAVGERVMGLVELIDEEERRDFTPQEIRLARSLAAQAAVAIDNARLYEQAQQEITQRRRIEQELQALTSRNEAILASVPDIIMEVDKDKIYTWANRAGMEFFGEGVIGKEAAFYFEGEQETYHAVQPIFNGEEDIIYVESWQRRRDGEKRLLAWWCRVLKDADGNVSGALSTARDITESQQAAEALRESEEKYRSLFENVPDGVYRTTPDGLILAANSALVNILGYNTQEELLETHIADLYVEPGERENVTGQFQRSDILRNAEIRLKRKDGAPINVLDNAHAVRDEHGEIVYYEGTLTDITALKQAETRLEGQAEELNQRYSELALLYEAGLTINRELDPRLQMEKLFETVMKALHAVGAEFFRHDAVDSVLRLEIGVGHYEQVQDSLSSLEFSIRDERGLVGWVGKNRVSLNVPDVLADPRWVVIDPEIRSALWVPVERENQLLGVIGVLSTRPDAFSEQHERLLSLFANQAAVALENARLFAETGRRLKHVQALRTIDLAISSSLDLQVTFDIFLEQVMQQLGIHAVDILKFDPHAQALEYAAGRGFRTEALQHTYLRLGEGYAGMAGLERRIIHISDLRNRNTDFLRSPYFTSEGFEACFCVPLLAKGQLKGVLEIFHRAPLEADQEWLDFVDTLAGQAAIAIENVTLFNDLQRSNVELTLAYDATIEGWSHALDLRDRETEGHTQRVASLTQSLAQVMGVSNHELIHIRRGALLHDIGKMGVPDDILRKPGPLDEEEWKIMHQHPFYAYEMLSPVRYLRPALDIPYCHHEKWDGSGYPRGLKGEQIPLAARLFAVVDVYDALTSDRPYRKAWPRKKALEYIQQQAGQHFDPEIVSAFMGMPALHELRNGDKISQT